MKESDIETLATSRKEFTDFVYLPLHDALRELEERRNDKELEKKVDDFLGNDIPGPLASVPRLVLARQLITPNHEIIRFLNIPDSVGITPLFFEYLDDKMIFKNPFKYHLGKLAFYIGLGKGGGVKIEQHKIIDFDAAHGEKISDVRTLMGTSLVDFHHSFLLKKFPQLKDDLFDGSEWYRRMGGVPAEYYRKFLALFVRHGILFENFLLDVKELSFTKEIFLPALIEVMKSLGKKPLIVALEPTEIEEDDFWLCYPSLYRELIQLPTLQERMVKSSHVKP